MATTTKKSPKAKTKTSKTTNKTAATKARSTAAKNVATNPAKASISGLKGVNLGRIRSLNIMAASVFVLLAVVAGTMMNQTSLQVTLGHLAKDDLLSTNTTVFAPAIQAVYDLQLRWAVVGIMLISAVLPILYVTKMQNRYFQYLQNSRMVPTRWFDLGVTLALMTEVAALLSGVSDMATLKLIGGITLVAALLSMIAERQNNAAGRVVRSAFLTGAFAAMLPWLLIASYAVGTVVYGAVRSPWYTYALYAAVFGGVLLLLQTQYKQYKRAGKYADYLVVERRYLTLNLLTKAAFAIILIVGLR